MNQTTNTTASIDLAQLDKLPSEQDMLDMATAAGLYPNTIHYWMPALQRYTEAALARRSLTSGSPANERAAFEVFARRACNMPDGVAINWDAQWTKAAWEGWEGRAAQVHDAAAPSNDQARYQMPEGVRNQIENLEWKVRNLERALEMRKLHEAGDVWYWQGDGADNLNSMSMGMIVVIRADSLRDLVSAGAAAKTEQTPMEYRTCCDHPDCTTCAGRGGFYRLSAGAAAKTDQDDDIRGPLTDAQREECRTLYNNLKHLQCGGIYVADDVIRRAAVFGYMNGRKDFGTPASAAGAGSAQPRAEGDERADFEPFTLAELDEMETVARAAPATWYGTYQIIDGISDEKAVELIEACSPDSIITLVRQARAALARAPLPSVTVQDERAHLTDAELSDPEYMRGYVKGCFDTVGELVVENKRLRAALAHPIQDGEKDAERKDAERWRFIVKDGQSLMGRFTLIRADDNGNIDELHGGLYDEAIDKAMAAAQQDAKGEQP